MPGIDPVSTGLTLAGTVASLFGAAKQAKLSKESLRQQQQLIDQQVASSKYIQGLSENLMGMGSTQVDPYGGVSGYDPVTKTYRSTLGPVQQQLQNASDAEEAQRLGGDQTLRRGALADVERNRIGAAGAERAGLERINEFNQGIGAVNASQLAAQMRNNRLGAVNAGYDDAARMASTLALRTGSSSAVDALKALARDRVGAQAQIGDPETEALTAAQGVNNDRLNNLNTQYGAFAQRGMTMPDVAFAPAPYADQAGAKLADQQKFDLSKYDVAQGGSGLAAQNLGQAATGLRAAYTDALSRPNMLQTVGSTVSGLAGNKDITGSISKMLGI